MLISHNTANLNGKQVDCISLDMHGRPTDLARNMEGKGRVRDGVNNEVFYIKETLFFLIFLNYFLSHLQDFLNLYLTLCLSF